MMENLTRASGMRLIIVNTNVACVLAEMQRQGMTCSPEYFEAVFKHQFPGFSLDAIAPQYEVSSRTVPTAGPAPAAR